ncbi:MAG: hypothetical protein IPO15_25865 [Anaerolineae bacterium]|uniref:hypothetical protein n=1 Tax=Candidatus Amarolinea dominans TaxID=3140696 RepID=UPI0031361AC4|nr:hypothetical protein [Anaerolineae bacterium]
MCAWAQLPTCWKTSFTCARFGPAPSSQPKIGIAFVAHEAQHQGPARSAQPGAAFGRQLLQGEQRLPYTEQLRTEILYRSPAERHRLHALDLAAASPACQDEINEDTAPAIFQAFRSGPNVSLAGHNLGGNNDVCNFVERRMAVGWDGGVAPCLPLLHDHGHFLKQYQARRGVTSWATSISATCSTSGFDHRTSPTRERVQSFAFAPCTFCGGCDLIEGNEEGLPWATPSRSAAAACGRKGSFNARN